MKNDVGKSRTRISLNADPDLLKGFDRIGFGTYTGSGFDRGHLVPCRDRSDTEKNNDAVFLMTNIVPQSVACNQNGWERLERYCRDIAADGKEVYIVGGPHGNRRHRQRRKKLTIGKNMPFVTVPASMWKVILVVDKGPNPTKNSRAIAVWMPNDEIGDTGMAGLSRFGCGSGKEKPA